jgi:indolepyruvate ferredoxin oxidoreductase alpha subunit
MNFATDGNRAIAQAAIESGIGYFSHYPGSPVNQVDVHLRELSARHSSNIIFNDALNEHVAVLAAAGASFSGMRSMVVMKHVGMNIAADPLNYLGYTGVNEGMVIVVGTDPGATCSTGEEDVHWYVPQVNFPLYEPTSVAGIRSCINEAYASSKMASIPALVFIPAALCFNVDFLPDPVPVSGSKKEAYAFPKDKQRYTNVGQQAVLNHADLLRRVKTLGSETASSQSRFQTSASVGLITRGLTFGHAYEAVLTLGLQNDVHLLNLERVYPLDVDQVREFAQGKREILVLEDQDGFLENQIKMKLFNDLDCRIYGKEILSESGAISYQQVHDLLSERFSRQTSAEITTRTQDLNIPERMGTYCEGCPHRASFFAMEAAVDLSKVTIGGDIGCSSLPPHKPDWLMCMNAGIGISQGMSSVLGSDRVISTGGDGSLFHLGLISLMSAVVNKIDLVHVLLDNATIAMTGHQASPSTVIDVEGMLRAIGVDRVVAVNAFEPDQLQDAIQSQLGQSGVSVIWVRGACALQPDADTIDRRKRRTLTIHNDRCGECSLCYDTLQCPAINLLPGQDKEIFVDSDRCMRCGVCIEICPNDAIEAIEA